MNLHPKSISFDLDEHWSQVQGLLRTEFDDTAYRTWLAPLDLVGLEGDGPGRLDDDVEGQRGGAPLHVERGGVAGDWG